MQVTSQNAETLARQTIADGFTLADYLNDETFVCECCEERFEVADIDGQIETSHPRLKFVCAGCADPILARWVAS